MDIHISTIQVCRFLFSLRRPSTRGSWGDKDPPRNRIMPHNKTATKNTLVEQKYFGRGQRKFVEKNFRKTYGWIKFLQG